MKDIDEMTRPELVDHKLMLVQELSRVNVEMKSGRLPDHRYRELQQERGQLVAEMAQAEAALSKVNLETRGSASMPRPVEEKCCLMVLEHDGRRFYHATWEQPDEWLTALLEDLDEDAPLVLVRCHLTKEQGDRLPQSVWRMPE